LAFAAIERQFASLRHVYGLVVAFSSKRDRKTGGRRFTFKLVPEWLPPRDTGGPARTFPADLLARLSPIGEACGFDSSAARRWREKWEIENRVRNAKPEDFSGRYSEPVSKLLELGQRYFFGLPERSLQVLQPIFRDLGLDGRHVPELIRLALDFELVYCSAKQPQTYAQFCAILALAHVGASEAVGPLSRLFEYVDDLGYLGQTLAVLYLRAATEADVHGLGQILATAPHPFGVADDFISFRFSHAGMAGLDRILRPSRRDPRFWAAAILSALAATKPELHDAATWEMTARLESYRENPSWLNARLVDALADNGVVEACELISEAFDQGVVDRYICGSQGEVLARLEGVKPS
jgi:hypothetical protein